MYRIPSPTRDSFRPCALKIRIREIQHIRRNGGIPNTMLLHPRIRNLRIPITCQVFQHIDIGIGRSKRNILNAFGQIMVRISQRKISRRNVNRLLFRIEYVFRCTRTCLYRRWDRSLSRRGNRERMIRRHLGTINDINGTVKDFIHIVNTIMEIIIHRNGIQINALKNSKDCHIPRYCSVFINQLICLFILPIKEIMFRTKWILRQKLEGRTSWTLHHSTFLLATATIIEKADSVRIRRPSRTYPPHHHKDEQHKFSNP